MKNTIRFYLILFGYALIIASLSTGLAGCGSASPESNEANTNTSPEPAPVAVIAGNGFSSILYNLALTEQDFRYLKDRTGDTSQIIFEFCVRKDSSKFTLKAYPGKNDNKLDTSNTKFLKPVFPSRFDFASQDALFPIQKLNRNKIKTIYDGLGQDSLDQVLLFYPEISNKGKINFEIVIFDTANLKNVNTNRPSGLVSVATNPSPPGRFSLSAQVE